MEAGGAHGSGAHESGAHGRVGARAQGRGCPPAVCENAATWSTPDLRSFADVPATNIATQCSAFPRMAASQRLATRYKHSRSPTLPNKQKELVKMAKLDLFHVPARARSSTSLEMPAWNGPTSRWCRLQRIGFRLPLMGTRHNRSGDSFQRPEVDDGRWHVCGESWLTLLDGTLNIQAGSVVGREDILSCLGTRAK